MQNDKRAKKEPFHAQKTDPLYRTSNRYFLPLPAHTCRPEPVVRCLCERGFIIGGCLELCIFWGKMFLWQIS